MSKPTQTKTDTYVEWKGRLYPVPYDSKYLAVDHDGKVWVYNKEPVLLCTIWGCDGGVGTPIQCPAVKPADFTIELYELEEL